MEVRHCSCEPVVGNVIQRENIYPYSFTEYLSAQGKEKNYLDVISTKDRADVLGMYHQYVKYGAFPELVSLASGNGTRMVGRYPQPLEKQDIEQIYRSLLPEEDL